MDTLRDTLVKFDALTILPCSFPRCPLTSSMRWSHSSSDSRPLSRKARGDHERCTTSPRHSSCAWGCAWRHGGAHGMDAWGRRHMGEEAQCMGERCTGMHALRAALRKAQGDQLRTTLPPCHSFVAPLLLCLDHFIPFATHMFKLPAPWSRLPP